MAGGFLYGEALRPARSAVLLVLIAGALTACASVQTPSPIAASGQAGGLRGTEKPYQVNGQWYYPKADPHYDEVGLASWYGYPFHLRRTANGELFDQNRISAAHKTLPLPCIVEVTNLENGRRLRVRVNDRGPFVDGRLIDVSKAAAEQLGFDRRGLTRVRVRYISAAAPLVPGLEQAAYSRPNPPPAPLQPPASDDDWNTRTAPYGGEQVAAAPPVTTMASWDGAGAASPAPIASPPPPTAPADGMSDLPVAAPETTVTEAPEPRIAEAPAYAPPAPNAPTSEPQALELAAPEPALSVAAEPPAAGGGFAVQAGAFSSRAAADRVAAQLADAGSPQVLPIQRNGATLYRVTIGAFPDPASAADARARVIASGFSDARVVQAF